VKAYILNLIKIVRVFFAKLVIRQHEYAMSELEFERKMIIESYESKISHWSHLSWTPGYRDLVEDYDAELNNLESRISIQKDLYNRAVKTLENI